MADVVERASADLREGRLWAARDRLTGALADRADGELLGLLGEVHYRMGDLPRAGAIWFVTDRSGSEAEEAAAAWRKRYGNDALELWRSIPSPVRTQHAAKLAQLRDDAVTSAKWRARQAGPLPADDPAHEATSGLGEAVGFVAVFTFFAAVLSLLVIGFVTVVRWIF